MERSKSESLFEKAKTLMPGGVNSPVRAFKSVGGTPVFIKKGLGAKIWDEDDNEYLDFCCSWGPLILGHANPKVVEAIQNTVAEGTSFGTPTKLENQLAELIVSNHSYVDKVRFVSSGTEATMSALRLARGVTGKNKVIKFEGCYHGHVDSLLVKAGSGLATLGTSTSAGIPESFAQETIVLPLNDKEAVEKAIEDYRGQIACIAIEPIPANNGLLIQGPEFLKFLREICTRENILLFFDEVISGFRIGFEGASGYYGISPDLLAFGKVIGGGLPVGAYGASNEVMSNVAPEGDVYQAGTLSGNPVAMSAGIAQLTECLKPNFYAELEDKTLTFIQKINAFAEKEGFEFKIFNMGSIFWLSFSNDTKVVRSSQIDPTKLTRFKVFYHKLLELGIYMGPSGYEVGFVSEAHTVEQLNWAAEQFQSALRFCYQKQLEY
ncbi:MAG: glutamate-1-semialdehyde 2,1-aminomutase [Flavobacteriales bacterium]|nr:glutamate-1-semialdehyde 2,1-aminomutase [Flavobacteriales bacterium]